ncbi:MAG: Yip1 family protein [Bacteroidales bacterium]|nr:Yip1 family protein [Bacteroidales bacterium]
MSDEGINFNKILKDSRETLLNPKGYFQSMPLSGGIAEPLIKAAIYGTIAGLFSLLWSVLGLSAMGAGLLGGAVGIMALIWSIIGAIIGLFIGGVIMLVISAICGGNTDFEANARVSASLMVLYPVNALLAFFYGINFTLGGIVGLVVSVFGIYLLYHAVIQALKGKESTARIVGIVLLVLVLLGFFGGRKASKAVRDYSDMFEEEQVD